MTLEELLQRNPSAQVEIQFNRISRVWTAYVCDNRNDYAEANGESAPDALRNLLMVVAEMTEANNGRANQDDQADDRSRQSEPSKQRIQV